MLNNQPEYNSCFTRMGIYIAMLVTFIFFFVGIVFPEQFKPGPNSNSSLYFGLCLGGWIIGAISLIIGLLEAMVKKHKNDNN